MTILTFSLKGQSKPEKHKMWWKLKNRQDNNTTEQLCLIYVRNNRSKGSTVFLNELEEECGLTNALLMASTKLSSSIWRSSSAWWWLVDQTRELWVSDNYTYTHTKENEWNPLTNIGDDFLSSCNAARTVTQLQLPDLKYQSTLFHR